MPRLLHPNANLEVLKKQAKEILAAHGSRDALCCEPLRSLHRFTGKSDADILDASVKLTEAQYALAMDYGFGSWSELRQQVGVGQRDVRAKLDLSEIELGNWTNGKDHFCLIIEAVARYFGLDADDGTIRALSANGFAPGIRPGESCSSWWQEYERGRCLDVIANSIGLQVEDLILPPDSGKEEELAEHMKTCAPIVARQLQREVVLITDGGWRPQPDAPFAAWCWGGIVTEIRDGLILGACLNGRADNVLYYTPNCSLLSACAPATSAEDTDRALFRHAIDRIRGAGRFAPDGSTVFGLAAMDQWIHRMETVEGFCAECFDRAPDRAWTDANQNAQMLYSDTRNVASYLRGRMASYPTASSRLEKVAKHYERISDLIGPAIATDSPAHYKQFIGELDRQREHADATLYPIKDELEKAAVEFEEALAIIDSGS